MNRRRLCRSLASRTSTTRIFRSIVVIGTTVRPVFYWLRICAAARVTSFLSRHSTQDSRRAEMTVKRILRVASPRNRFFRGLRFIEFTNLETFGNVFLRFRKPVLCLQHKLR